MKAKQKSSQKLPDISLKAIDYPEIVIGLVGPLGTDLETAYKSLETRLDQVGYKSHLITLSKILSEIFDPLEKKLKKASEDSRVKILMDAGNSLREKTSSKDALAILAMGAIKRIRKDQTGNGNQTLTKAAYVLRYIKNKEEAETLRNIYGENFFLVSIYTPLEKRIEYLTKRISGKKKDKTGRTKKIATELAERDYKEEITHGQNVRGAFPLADLFIRGDSPKLIDESLERFINTLFGYPFSTPTKDEMGMFNAFGIALRSADLSRQVGAAIVDKEGDIVTIGCNEVPKFGGGMYWEDDINNGIKDGRDFILTEYDSSAYMKREIVEDLLERLQEAKILRPEYKYKKLTDDLLFGEKKAVLDDAPVTDILEYGRIIHAEMAAITDAAKRGLALKGKTLHCTTFPCHICARHIIASGIERVLYVEPYPKSKATDLYEDSIKKDPEEAVEGFVTFEPFVGVAPRRFRDFFSMTKRKDAQGTATKWTKSMGKPKVKTYVSSYVDGETKLLSLLTERIAQLGIKSF